MKSDEENIPPIKPDSGSDNDVITALELIDFEKKGNAVRLYFGKKNGEQAGDDWDDRPYECNAGIVYQKYVKQTIDAFFSLDTDVSEPADSHLNSSYCKNDFINRKSWILWIEKEWGDQDQFKPVGVFFGDTFKEIKEKLKQYQPFFREVKDEQENEEKTRI